MATIFPIADWARHVGGDRVYVQTLLPVGASPHTFEPTPRDMRMIASASLFFKVGLHLDDWGARLTSAQKGKGTIKVIDLGDSLASQGKLLNASDDHDSGEFGQLVDADHDHEHESFNPHFWLDPELAVASVELIRDALIDADPDGETIYRSNAEAYVKELRTLDGELANSFKPFAGRAIVTFHNAWPYLTNRYNLKIAGVIEEYAGKTPSESYLRSLTDLIRAKKIKTIFIEPQLDPRVANVLGEETGVGVSVLDPYGVENSEDTGNYIAMMRFNKKQLVTSFKD